VKWLPVIPSLYVMSLLADIILMLFAHGMIIERDASTKGSTTANSSNTALAAKANDSCTNLNCKAKKRCTHTISKCYWPGGGKEGQFPLNFGQRNRANTATSGSSTSQPDHFVLLVQVSKFFGQSGIVINNPSDHLPWHLSVKGFKVSKRRRF
jgi:hypothetical protein